MRRIFTLLATNLIILLFFHQAKAQTDCSTATDITASITGTCNTIVNTDVFGTAGNYPDVCVTNSLNAIYYSFVAPYNGIIDVSNTNDAATPDTDLAITEGDCTLGTWTCLTPAGQFPDDAGAGFTSQIIGVPVVAGQEYFIEWTDDWATAPGAWELQFAVDPGASLSGAVGLTDATLAYDATCPNMTYEYGLAGFAQGAGIASGTSTGGSLNLTGLTSATTYDICFFCDAFASGEDATNATTCDWSLSDAGAGSETAAIQCISFTTSAACGTPGGTATLELTGDVTVNLTAGATGAGLFEMEWGALGFTPGTGTELGSVVGTTNTTETIAGLPCVTDIDIYARDDCGAPNGTSLWFFIGTINSNNPGCTDPGALNFDPGACVDDASCMYSALSIPNCYDMEGGSLPINWTGAIGTGTTAANWNVDSGGTTSVSTGPSVGALGSTFYLYLETSSPTATNQTVTVFAPDYDLSDPSLTAPALSFWLHMFGFCMGTFDVEIEAPSGSGNFTNIFTQSGDQGDVWNPVAVDLTPYLGQVVSFAISGTTCDESNGGFVFEGDMAIDEWCVIDATVCGIVTPGISGADCQDNLTTSDPSDDFFVFNLDPNGTALGTTYTVSGDVTGTGTYGGPFLFDNGGAGWPAGGGDLNITITDDNDPTCTYATTIVDPGTCSFAPACGNQFYDSGLDIDVYQNNENIVTTICPDIPGEIVSITFTYVDIETTVAGGGLNGTGCWDYLTVFDGSSTASNNLGDYCGEPSGDGGITGGPAMQLTLGTVFTSTDASGCLTFQFQSDGSVQETGWEADVVCFSPNNCAILSAGDSAPVCFNNGTPSDQVDDFFEVDLSPTGLLVSTYTVTDASGAVVGAAGNPYATPTTFGPFPAGVGNVTLTLTDDTDPTCTFNVTINDTGDCSPFVIQPSGACEDFDAGISTWWVQSTTDNFDWSVSTNSATGSIGTGPQNGDNTTGTGQFLFIETSGAPIGNVAQISSAWDLTGTVAPGVTFFYDMFGAQIGTLNIIVDDGTTLTNVFTLSGDQGSGWVAAAADLTPWAGQFVTIIIEAITNGSYAGDISIDDFCVLDANVCNILSAGATQPICFNNGTPSDPVDDFFEVQLNPTGLLLSTYTVTDASGAIIGSAGNAYGAPITFGPFPAGGGDVTLTLTDDVSAGCTQVVTILDTGDCSPFLIQPAGACSDFDTGIPGWWVQSTTDNFDWSVGASTPSTGTGPQAGDNTSGTGQFIYIETSGAPVGNVAQMASAWDLSGTTAPGVTFFYDMFGAQIGTLNIIVDDGTSLTNVFSISGDQGSGWVAAAADLTPWAGQTITIIIEAITNGSFEGDISLDDFCVLDANICNILSAGATQAICFNNGTPSDPVDDFFEFDLNPSGLLLSTYTVTDASGAIVGTAGNAYGMATTFGPFPAGGGDVTLTLTDDNDPACTQIVTITDTGDCSPFIIQTFGSCTDFDTGIPGFWVQSGTDNFDWTVSTTSSTPSLNTGPQAGDNTTGTGQFIYIETSGAPVGNVAQISSAWDLNGTTAPTILFSYDMFGAQIGTLNIIVDDGSSLTNVFTLSGDQGSGWVQAFADLTPWSGQFVTITIEAITNGGYQGDISLDDFCVIDANQCSILDAGEIVSTCDPFNNTYTFTLDPSGILLQNGYTVSGDLTGASAYGTPLLFGPFAVGGAPHNLIITDDDDPACTFAVTVNPANDCPPLNDECINAFPLSFALGQGPYTNDFATVNPADDPATYSCGTQTIDNTVWFTFTGNGGDITFTTQAGTNTDTEIEIYDDCPSTGGAVIACDDDGNGLMSTTTFLSANGQTYYAAVDGWNGNTGNFSIDLETSIPPCSILAVALPPSACDNGEFDVTLNVFATYPTSSDFVITDALGNNYGTFAYGSIPTITLLGDNVTVYDLIISDSADPFCSTFVPPIGPIDCPVSSCPSLFSFNTSTNVACDGDVIDFTAMLLPGDATNASLTVALSGSVAVSVGLVDDGTGLWTGSIPLSNADCAPSLQDFTLTVTCTDDGTIVAQQTEDVTVYPNGMGQFVSTSTSADGCTVTATVDPACSGFITLTSPATYTAAPGEMSDVDFCYEYFSASAPQCITTPECLTVPVSCAGCSGDAGIMPNGIIPLCWGQTASIATSGSNVGPGDVFAYMIHDGSGVPLGWNLTGVILNDDPMFVNIDGLFVSAVVGPAGASGYPDLMDACTSVALPGTPIRFISEIVIDSEIICNLETGEYQVTFMITGGYPEFPNSNNAFYDVSGDYTGQATAGINYTFGPLENETYYAINVDDDQKGCGATESEFVDECTITPVTLLNYSGEALADGNMLKWTTAAEINNDYFTLEVSEDGIDFRELANIDGAGTVSSINNYSYLDTEATFGTSYYRLSQTDFDGTHVIEGIVSITRTETLGYLNLQPVPAVDFIEVSFSSHTDTDVSILIADLSGKILNEEMISAKKGANNISIDLMNYSAGVYMLTVINGNDKLTKKLIKE